MADDPGQAAHSGPARASDLRARAMDLLDFPAIRERLAVHTTFLPSRELALALAPVYGVAEVEALRGETSEAVRLLADQGDANLHLGEDPEPLVARAGLGGTLAGSELRSVSRLLEVLRQARTFFLRGRAAAPRLAEAAGAIPDLADLERAIAACIGSRGEVLDDATPNLGVLRRQTRQAYQAATDALTRIMRSAVGAETLQDDVITIRSERLVLQVKAEMRHRLPGIVHGGSNTGATLFIEPFATVDGCNTWRELVLEEEREVHAVLADLSGRVGWASDDIRRGSRVVARLDLVLAKGRYGAALKGIAIGPPPGGLSAPVDLRSARHPLLGDRAVPISVRIGPGWSVLVITGPNTGGKTVSMKTVGLLALMGQAGLLVPAGDGSHLPVFDGIYADVGDQQSIEGAVSTFGSHMRNVIGILEGATPASLVLLDELGTSTDPEEGSALAKAVLDRLASLGTVTVTTTHHRTVAAYAQDHPGMSNASLDLDPSTFGPTYHLTAGLPGRSHAMSIASRMGLPPDILGKAASLLDPRHQRLEGWLAELERDRQLVQAKLLEAEEARAQAEEARREAHARLEEMSTRRQEMLEQMGREVEARYEAVRRRLRRLEAALSWRGPEPGSASETGSPAGIAQARDEPQHHPVTGAMLSGIAQARDELQSLGREVAQAAAPPPPPTPAEAAVRPLAAGDPVEVRGLNLRGVVLSVSAPEQEAEVAVGKVRLRLHLARLIPAPAPPEADAPSVRVERSQGLPGEDLDLRGLRAEAAIFRVEGFLDRAVGDGLSRVRIIHGVGTGALRRAVREHLALHSLARAFGPETPERGGDGVTVVDLV